VQAFADWYLTKNVVLNAEAGHSLSGVTHRQYTNHHKYEVKEKFRDDVLFRVSMLYRVRFD
jgi:hypothetical protein